LSAYIGQRLLAARQAAGLTRTQLAQRSRSARATITKIEQGAGGRLSMEVYFRIAAVLGLRFDEVLLEAGRDAWREFPSEEPHSERGCCSPGKHSTRSCAPNESGRSHMMKQSIAKKKAKPQALDATPLVLPMALYARTSSEDQAERGTIKGQLAFLRDYAKLMAIPVFDEYADDGISGTIPLAQRPDGQRLLQDAERACFGGVLLYRVDRLGRSLTALLDAHDQLASFNITLRSATEPFDTSTPIGTFLFQLLGSLAQLEKATILERTSMGRDRIAKEGRWTGGVLPVGYDLDTEGFLMPSERVIPALEMTEADMVRDLFQRIANGSSSLTECHRLNRLGVTTAKRYANGVEVDVGAKWRRSRLSKTLKSRVYIGQHTVRSARGAIVRHVPALVSEEIFEAVQAQIRRNSCLPKNTVHRLYLLRSLVTCRLCKSRYVGTPINRGNGKTAYYYRCGGQTVSQRPEVEDRCQAKILQAEPLEEAVCAYCRDLVLHPEQALERVKQRIIARQITVSAAEDTRQEIQRRIAALEDERQRVMTLYTRGHKSLDDVEADLARIAAAKTREQEKLDAVKTQRDVATVLEAHYHHVTSILEDLQEEVREIEQTQDFGAKRRIVEIIIRRIPVETTVTGTRKHANVYIDDLFDQSSVVETLTLYRESIDCTTSEVFLLAL
jgi:site-specific DNA recombinase